MDTDRAMITTPDLWPRWPLLPVKRGWHDEPAVAVIMEHPGGMVIAYGQNLWDDLKEAKWETFDVDELLKEGWVVD